MIDKRGIIDLHIHTNESDGTDTPDALISKLREAGIRYFSVTDHTCLKEKLNDIRLKQKFSIKPA